MFRGARGCSGWSFHASGNVTWLWYGDLQTLSNPQESRCLSNRCCGVVQQPKMRPSTVCHPKTGPDTPADSRSNCRNRYIEGQTRYSLLPGAWVRRPEQRMLSGFSWNRGTGTIFAGSVVQCRSVSVFGRSGGMGGWAVVGTTSLAQYPLNGWVDRGLLGFLGTGVVPGRNSGIGWWCSPATTGRIWVEWQWDCLRGIAIEGQTRYVCNRRVRTIIWAD